jgi:hypothetical protein
MIKQKFLRIEEHPNGTFHCALVLPVVPVDLGQEAEGGKRRVMALFLGG